MDDGSDVIEGFQKIKLTVDEEVNIAITAEKRGNTLEECSLSLFGKFQTSRPFNRRAARDTMRSVWRMGSELQILEVGNDILQFKFPTEFQRQWVVDNGPWSFENNLLLLRRWERGLSFRTIQFTHSLFWIQIWGLPFELVSEKVGEDIGNRIGKFVASDERKGVVEQARYLRIRVEVPIDKPLRRGGFVISPEGDRCWVDYRYERLTTFCFECGRLGHERRSCPHSNHEREEETPQYGEWLRATFNGKLAVPRELQGGSGMGGKKSPVNEEIRQVASMTMDLVQEGVETGGVIQQPQSDMETSCEVKSRTLNGKDKRELVVGKGQQTTTGREDSLILKESNVGLEIGSQSGKTNLAYGRKQKECEEDQILEEPEGVGGDRHAGEIRGDPSPYIIVENIPQVHSEQTSCCVSKDRGTEKVHKVNVVPNRDGEGVNIKEGHVGELGKNGALQELHAGERRAQQKWKRLEQPFAMHAVTNDKIMEGCTLGDKRGRDENFNPNRQLSVSKKLKYASDCRVVDEVLEAAVAGQQPRRPQ